MKKLLFFATIILSGLSVVNAQKSKSIGGFNQGDIFATGAISFGSSETGDMKESQFEFNPSAGLFISDNIAIGVALGLETRKNKRGSLPELKTKAFAVGAFGQYYFTPQDQFSLVSFVS
jgi:outer membrane protein